MALLGFLRKKKNAALELPPPPRMSDASSFSDIPDIRVGDELPPPPKPQKQAELPPEIELPVMEMPEFPAVPVEEQNEEDTVQVREIEQEPMVMDKTVQPVEIPREVVRRSSVRKTFVSVDDYSLISSYGDSIRERLADAELLVKRLNELKVEENKSFDRWLSQLEDIEKKLSRVDSLLARAQS